MALYNEDVRHGAWSDTDGTASLREKAAHTLHVHPCPSVRQAVTGMTTPLGCKQPPLGSFSSHSIPSAQDDAFSGRVFSRHRPHKAAPDQLSPGGQALRSLLRPHHPRPRTKHAAGGVSSR